MARVFTSWIGLFISRYRGAQLNARKLGRSTWADRKSTRLNSSHQIISYAVFCLKKKTRCLIMAIGRLADIPGIDECSIHDFLLYLAAPVAARFVGPTIRPTDSVYGDESLQSRLQ